MPDDTGMYITSAQAVEILGCSKGALRKLPLPIHRPTGKRGMFKRDEVEELRHEFKLAREAAALEVLD